MKMAPPMRPMKAAPVSLPEDELEDMSVRGWRVKRYCASAPWEGPVKWSAGARSVLIGNADGGHGIILHDGLHDVEPFDDLSEDGVDAIQVPGIGFTQNHEELAAARVFSGVRHGERADGVPVRVASGFAGDSPSWAARADAAIAFGEIA